MCSCRFLLLSDGEEIGRCMLVILWMQGWLFLSVGAMLKGIQKISALLNIVFSCSFRQLEQKHVWLNVSFMSWISGESFSEGDAWGKKLPFKLNCMDCNYEHDLNFNKKNVKHSLLISNSSKTLVTQHARYMDGSGVYFCYNCNLSNFWVDSCVNIFWGVLLIWPRVLKRK